MLQPRDRISRGPSANDRRNVYKGTVVVCFVVFGALLNALWPNHKSIILKRESIENSRWEVLSSDLRSTKNEARFLGATTPSISGKLQKRTEPVAESSDLEKHLIIAMAQNIEFNHVYRFVKSARTFMPASSTDIVLLMDAPSIKKDFEELFRIFDVKVAMFDISRDLLPHQAQYHPSSFRWLLMRKWLRNQGDFPKNSRKVNEKPYDWVFFVDSRDTVFQRDVFDSAIKMGVSGFYAFQESAHMTIAGCGWNSGWVKACYGEEGLGRVSSKVISCSGTSLASWETALLYADVIADALENSVCERNGIDQGIHNYIVYSGELERRGVSPLLLISNENGFIATVQSMPTLRRNRAGQVINKQGVPYAVVHQYDRSPALKQQYDREFRWLDHGEVDVK